MAQLSIEPLQLDSSAEEWFARMEASRDILAVLSGNEISPKVFLLAVIGKDALSALNKLLQPSRNIEGVSYEEIKTVLLDNLAGQSDEKDEEFSCTEQEDCCEKDSIEGSVSDACDDEAASEKKSISRTSAVDSRNFVNKEPARIWREEVGFLEMFLAYHKQFEINLPEKKTPRDLLFDILCHHEASVRTTSPSYAVTLTLPTEDRNPPLEETAPFNYPALEETASFNYPPLEEAVAETMADVRASFPFSFVNPLREEQDNMTLSEKISKCIFEEMDFQSGSRSVISRSNEDSCSIANPNADDNISLPYPVLKSSENLQYDNDISLPPNEGFTYFAGGDPMGQFRLTICKSEDEVPSVVCKTCNERFFSNETFAAHMKVDDEVGDRMCHLCKKTFRTDCALKRHARVHSNVRPYHCIHCQRSFKNLYGLKTHERMHSSERPFRCQQCDRSYRYMSSLQAHNRTHSNERPYVCKLCQRTFKFLSSLTAHVNSHSTERRFACTTCNRRYSHKGSLNRHLAFPCAKPFPEFS